MRVKRFVAADMRSVLREVREELGADEVILSNRKVNGQVEILAARDYDALSTVVEGITVTSAFRRKDAEAGRAVLDNTVRALELFQQGYGPYPYETFTTVEGEMFGGMEYSGLVLVGSPFYTAYQAAEEKKEQSVLPALTVPELAHQWWYNVVGNDQVREPCLDESLARYSLKAQATPIINTFCW